MTTIAAVAAIVSEYRGAWLQRYAFKPVPVLLMLIAVAMASSVPALVRWCFAGALLASAIGDVLLIDRRRFVYGLLAFLLAHIAYIFGIWFLLDAPPRVLYVLPLTIWGGTLFWYLRRNLHALEFPVLIYIAVILVMIWLAGEHLFQSSSLGAKLLFAGAISFGLSDTLLAIDHFRQPFRAARAAVLSTYYVAQCCLACALLVL